jgi:hypothetical protein
MDKQKELITVNTQYVFSLCTIDVYTPYFMFELRIHINA